MIYQLDYLLLRVATQLLVFCESHLVLTLCVVLYAGQGDNLVTQVAEDLAGHTKICAGNLFRFSCFGNFFAACLFIIALAAVIPCPHMLPVLVPVQY